MDGVAKLTQEAVAPGGSFYAFPRFPEGTDPKAFLGAAIERKVLIVPAAEIAKEFYVAVVQDRASKRPIIIASAAGGAARSASIWRVV